MDLAAAFQEAVTDVLADRADHAMATFAAAHDARAMVVAGGVAANARLRAALAEAAARRNFKLIAPPMKLCGDNAVMVAWAGIERIRIGLVDRIDHAPRPRWPLSGLTLGSGWAA
jgi:N6-L-threonylcarbamoyladenine synthase